MPLLGLLVNLLIVPSGAGPVLLGGHADPRFRRRSARFVQVIFAIICLIVVLSVLFGVWSFPVYHPLVR